MHRFSGDSVGKYTNFPKNISQRTNKSVLWDTYLYKNVKNAGFALV